MVHNNIYHQFLFLHNWLADMDVLHQSNQQDLSHHYMEYSDNNSELL